AQRKLSQTIENYQLKLSKAKAQMGEVGAKLANNQRQHDFLTKLVEDFRVVAPEPGMVIYKRNWRGQKIGIGSAVEVWDPVVATLPDLSKMVSKTFVNEVDIRVIEKGQEANIGLDAFPEKKLTGKVIEVANIGEQKPNSDSKVFQVTLEINELDTTLRPAMTTSNTIISEIVPDVLYAPLETVHSQGDTLSYVLKRTGTGFVKQEVALGKTNSNEIILEGGVEEGDQLFLSVPKEVESALLILLEKQESITSK
ncbi:MAG: efflux RND transporter periplasmic adaptor subunit, partial [Cyclobacteriaceae bacterium]|nr:efflux RND transporter periplasmic adaptor subunit [Cyclobacteriaceae bacterium]